MAENILFGAELDTGAFRKGANDMVSSLESVGAAVTKATEKMDDFTFTNNNVASGLSKQRAELFQSKLSLEEENRAIENVNAAMNKLYANSLRPVKANVNIGDITNAGIAVQKLTLSLETLRAKMLVKQDLLIRETDIAKIAIYNKEIQALQVQINQLSNVGKAGFDGVGNAIAKTTAATGGLSRGFGFLRQAAAFLPGIGLIGIINLISDAVVNMVTSLLKGENAINTFAENYKNVIEVVAEGNKKAGKQIADLDLLYSAATNVNLTIKERTEAVKALQKEFPDYFGNIDKETILNGKAKEAYDALKDSIIQVARATAAKAKIDEIESKKLDIDFQKQKINTATLNEKGRAQATADVDEYGRAIVQRTRLEEQAIIEARRLKAIKEQELKEKSLNQQEDFLKSFIGEKAITKVVEDEVNKRKDKKTKEAKDGNKEIENVYEQQLLSLKSKLAALNENVLVSDETITAKVKAGIDKQYADIDKYLKDKKLTGPQAINLKRLVGIIGDTELQKELTDFHKKRVDAEKELDKDLDKLRLDEAEKRVANIQDEFERERAAIQLELEKGKDQIKANQEAIISRAQDKKDKGLITQEQFTATVTEVNATTEKLYDDLYERIAIKNRVLGGKLVDDLINEINKASHVAVNNIAIGGSEEVRFQAELLLKGKISYDDYQKALVEIAYRRGQERIAQVRKDLEAELRIVNQRLQGNIPDDERKKRTQQQSDLQKQITDLGTEQLTNEVNNDKKGRDQKAEHLNKVIALYQSFAQVVGGFLKDIETAEAQRLDRSIALQEKRVANAKELAEKGNAQYLELEQKRMDELQRKREENARKQLAIDDALRLSQATVAAVSAIATAAGTGNPFLIIGAAVAVLAAIGAAYSMVNQLQAPSAQFYEGTTFVHGKEGRDKIPAKLTRGEAVIPAETNKKYSETVNAIYNNTVPAEILNYFVKAYPTTQLPIVDYSRIGLATDRHFIDKGSGETNKKLDTLNSTLGMVVDKLENLDNVSMVLDSDGFAISIIRAARSEKMKWLM